ncbi:MAG TPA: TM1812 family CRISPR-associated protein [Candidatus Fimimorpha faecalis]|uniref:TM1812 family CRISPR-associated protein n=1 Tax=Candidatus Fimimorpha faecalis TaxID=2840824 RepID=A0A9D1EDF3_9FIRM|nr:TM1812 family CRISPR-associated protein [Candidatus Fimimorpha faecalis]
MGKGIILLFLSGGNANSNKNANNKGEKSPEYYGIEGKKEEKFLGLNTNDAPVKYLLYCAAKNGDIIQKIVCIVTKEVKRDKDDEKFKDMVNDYIRNDPRVKDYYKGIEIEFIPMDYDMEVERTEERSLQLYRQISKTFINEEQSNVYIDYTGGLRDINFLMTVIIRYLEYHNSVCKKIVYSNFSKKRIDMLDSIYSMFQLLNGIDQFTQTGNAELLEKYSEKEENERTKDLLEKIVKFSKVMSICDIKAIEKLLPDIDNGLKNYEKNAARASLFGEIFRDMIGIIKKKLYIEAGKSLGYPELIRWCLDNNMIQQALTLYIEKIPSYYYDTDMLIMPQEKIMESQGKTKEIIAFYEKLYDSLVDKKKDEKIENFKKILESLNTESMKISDLKQKKGNSSKENQILIDQLIQFLDKYYECKLGKRKKDKKMTELYQHNAKDGRAYINALRNDSKLIYTFVYREEREGKKIETYKKKLQALDKVKEGNVQIQESNIDNEQLYQIMKYYLALKVMRNRINHAAEDASKESEEQAIAILKKDHGLCMDIEFDNVKKLIRDGLEASGISMSDH